jgi:drug/metabolite transporter (DMT)-like permease
MSTRRSIGEGAGTAQGGLLAVLALLLAATLWGTLWYPLRLLESAGMSGLWSTLVLYLAALCLTPWLLRGSGGTPWRRNARWLLVMTVASGWCNLAFILAVIEGQVVRVLLLFYLSPIWAVLLGHWLLHERITARAVVILVVALSGAGIMLWDAEIGMPWPQDRADWLATSSGFAFALLNVTVRRLQAVAIGVKTIVTWIGVVVVSAVWIALSDPSLPQLSAPAWGGAALLGLVGMSVMTLSVQYGVTHMPIQRSAIILLFEVVAGAVSAYLLAGETLGAREWLGGGLIVLSAYLSARK